ncbi:MAG: trigger factor [Chloroflexota bacterium]|nr:trigger factor [Chloroflexota bacterium]
MSTDPQTADPTASAHADGGERTTSPDGSFRYRFERLAGSLAKIEVEVDATRLRSAADRQFEKHNRQANIPGFRPGKAPRAIYERHYGTQHLWNEGAEDVIDETYREILQAHDVDPLDRPNVEMGTFEPGKDLTYTATVAVRPEVKLGDYASHGAKVEPKAPTDEDVERVIEDMREHHAELRPVDRPAEKDDVVTVDIDAKIAPLPSEPADAKPRELTLARNGHLELGRTNVVPGLAEGIVGMKATEERALELTFPEDADEDLRGRTGSFSVRVSQVAEKVLPPLDESFARTVGVADLAALRKAVRDELAHGAFHEARDAAADTAVDHALATSEVEVPEVLVQDEIERLLADLRQRVEERGLTWERFLLQAKRTEAEIREQWRPAAERRARSLLVLDAIAKKEGVTVSSTELAQEVALTPLAQQDPQALRSPQVLAAMARSMRDRKVVDKLIGLETPEAERAILRELGADVDVHGPAERAGDDAEQALESAQPAPPHGPSGIVVPERSNATAEGREAIRELLTKKE